MQQHLKSEDQHVQFLVVPPQVLALRRRGVPTAPGIRWDPSALSGDEEELKNGNDLKNEGRVSRRIPIGPPEDRPLRRVPVC